MIHSVIILAILTAIKNAVILQIFFKDLDNTENFKSVNIRIKLILLLRPLGNYEELWAPQFKQPKCFSYPDKNNKILILSFNNAGYKNID